MTKKEQLELQCGNAVALIRIAKNEMNEYEKMDFARIMKELLRGVPAEMRKEWGLPTEEILEKAC